MRRDKISVVSPVYNCAEALVELHRRLVATLSQLPGVERYELVFVDDASTDQSWDVLRSISELDRNVRALRLTRNFGQHHALAAGLEMAEGDWVVVLDADLQDPPEAIRELWAKTEDGFDIIEARRAVRTDPLWRRAGSRVFHWLFAWLSGLRHDPQVANYRLMNGRVVDVYRKIAESSPNLGAQLQWLGYSRTIIDIRQEVRSGESGYTLSKLLKVAFDAAIAYSNRPLRLAVGVGLTIATVAGAASAWIVLRALVWGIPVEGWASLMASIWFLGGAVIATVGVVGIYVGRVYDEAKGRPLYVVSEKLNC